MPARLTALAALLCPLAMAVTVAVALAGDVAIAVLAVALVAGTSAGLWVALTNRGGARLLGGVCAGLAAAGLIVVLATNWQGIVVLALLIGLVILFGLTARLRAAAQRGPGRRCARHLRHGAPRAGPSGPC